MAERSIDFHAHHSPVGAWASFTMGRIGGGGGFGLELDEPAKQDIYIAYSRGGETPKAFPFYVRGDIDLAEYLGEGDHSSVKDPRPKWDPFPAEAIARSYRWASDSWSAGDMTFTLYTPFGSIPDPREATDEEMKLAAVPAIIAEIEFDNRRGREPACILFGLRPWHRIRLLPEEGPLVGVASGREKAIAASREDGEAHLLISPDPAANLREGKPVAHAAFKYGGLFFRCEPGEILKRRVAIAFYKGGTVTAGIECRYLYARHFASIEEVLEFALLHADELVARAKARDRELEASPLNEDRKFMIAHSTRSYFGSTQLFDAKGKTLWSVLEGEFGMINTFDLTVDHLFFEMKWNPWTVANALDLYADRYSYREGVFDSLGDKRAYPGGISFTHDMGQRNVYFPKGRSIYETPGLKGCYSYMTHEQLCNWVSCAGVYVLGSGDIGWLSRRRGTFEECLESLVARDHPDPARRTGVMKFDSLRCTTDGQEITTYDSLDASLGQARNNLYLAVKTWAAYVLLEAVFKKLKDKRRAALAADQAARAAESIAGKYLEREGFIPAVFEGGNRSAIIPAIEGCVFPAYVGDKDAVSPDGRFGKLIKTLTRHLVNVMKPGVCIDRESGAWKLSSTSNNSWAGKTYLCQHVARDVLKAPLPDRWEEWDRIHADFQRNACRDWAACDQLVVQTGRPIGSKYYPRLVTSILWMGGTVPARSRRRKRCGRSPRRKRTPRKSSPRGRRRLRP